MNKIDFSQNSFCRYGILLYHKFSAFPERDFGKYDITLLKERCRFWSISWRGHWAVVLVGYIILACSFIWYFASKRETTEANSERLKTFSSFSLFIFGVCVWTRFSDHRDGEGEIIILLVNVFFFLCPSKPLPYYAYPIKFKSFNFSNPKKKVIWLWQITRIHFFFQRLMNHEWILHWLFRITVMSLNKYKISEQSVES